MFPEGADQLVVALMWLTSDSSSSTISPSDFFDSSSAIYLVEKLKLENDSRRDLGNFMEGQGVSPKSTEAKRNSGHGAEEDARQPLEDMNRSID